MTKCISILLAIALYSCQVPHEQTLKPEPPNIIFIMADDLGYGDIGTYGQEKIKTPAIDRLAEEGMKFTQFYAGSPVCAPSRSVLLTGLHTGHTPVRGNLQFGLRNGQQPLPDSIITLAECMKKGGYKTGMIGKWGLGNPGTPGDPLNQGWDYYFGYTDQVLAHNYFPEYLLRNGERVYLENEVAYLDSTEWHAGLGSRSTRKVEYSHDLFLQDALSFIEENKAEKFFLYLPFTVPHINDEALEHEQQEVPDQGIYADMEWEKNAKDYAAMVTRMDEGIADIMRLLADLGINENTLVVFTSDNGPLPNRSYTEFLNSNGPLRGGKRDLYEGGIRIPFIVRWTGRVEAGAVSEHVGAFWDLLPTFSEFAQVPLETPVDGISLVPVFFGKSPQQVHSHLYWEFHEQKGSQAILQGKWKAVRQAAKANPDNALELYDLSVDIGEENNLANHFSGKVRELDSLMQASRSHSEIFPFGREGSAFRSSQLKQVGRY